MKVENTWGVPNQFTIYDKGNVYFQSYKTLIAQRVDDIITLDNKWDWSRTTTKYLNKFLGTDNKKEIIKGIKEGKYKVADLNFVFSGK